MLKKILTTSLLFLSTGAYAYGDHASWSGMRGGLFSSCQFITETAVVQSTVKNELEDGTVSSVNYKGMGIKTGLGIELVKFVRFDIYHMYKDTSNNPSTSLRGSEVGGDVQLLFQGPIINVLFGFGLFGDSMLSQTTEKSVRYFGSGIAGSIGFEKFIDPKASVVFSVKGQSENLRPELSAEESRPTLNTTAATLGLLLWLN